MRIRRNSLLTFAAQPWTLCETDPGEGGGGGAGTTPAVNEHGFPDATPVAQMSAEQQVSYWKYQSRKHEQRASQVPDAAELEALRAAKAELDERKASEMTDAQRVEAARAQAEAEASTQRATAEAAIQRALTLEVALDKGLPAALAQRLQGSTREELEADAEALLKLVPGTPQDTHRRPPTGSGSDVKPARTISAGEERYKARHGQK